MEKEFYPLLTRTLKSLLDVMVPEDYAQYIPVLTIYPKCDRSCEAMDDDMYRSIITELDRQYARWKRGAAK